MSSDFTFSTNPVLAAAKHEGHVVVPAAEAESSHSVDGDYGIANWEAAWIDIGGEG
jgi:hypothetical protein